jgi:probable rRNA maturation factor
MLPELKIDCSMCIEDEQWHTFTHVNIEDFVKKYICAAFYHSNVQQLLPQHLEVSVLLTNDASIQEINNEYRGKNKPTNVLSFPQEENILDVKDASDCVLIGDIVLSFDTIQREATQQNKEILHHLAHLIVHGALHLVGYDHETDDEATAMESLEVEILAQYGIDNPYKSDFEHTV